MSPLDMARECVRVIQTQGDAAFIVVIGKLPARGWPRGQCLGSDSRGKFYSYDAWKLLIRLQALGVAKHVGTRNSDNEGMDVSLEVAGTTYLLRLNAIQASQYAKATKGFILGPSPVPTPLPQEKYPS